MAAITAGLFIKGPWIDLILEGKKTWELRSTRTAKRERIALIESGSRLIKGTCEIVGVRGALQKSTLLKNLDKHQVPRKEIEEGLRRKSVFAWVIANPKWLHDPPAVPNLCGPIVWIDLTRFPEVFKIVNSRG
jgi:hypothetical protein